MQRSFTPFLMSLAGVAAVSAMLATDARGQSVESFYQGRNIDLYSGHSMAGAYTSYARLLERHMSQYIPGKPRLILRIMEGGSGLTVANWLYNAAPKDGGTFGIFHERMGLEPVVAPQGTQFDGRKFSWIGSLAKQTSVCFTWHESKVRTVDDARRQSIPVGASGAAASDSVMPRIMNAMLGTQFQIIRGYAGDVAMLAIERGEVEGRCGFGWASLKTTRPDWFEQKRINLLAQFSLKPHPELPNVPVLMDLVEKPDDKRALELVFATQEMGRPFTAPPGIPGDRLQALRQAFNQTVKNSDFLADAAKQNLEIDAITGEEITALLERLYDTPKEIAERVATFRKGGAGEKQIKR